MRLSVLRNRTYLPCSSKRYSLRPVSETGEKLAPVAVQTEKDVFDLLGMEYLEPEKRNW